MIQSDTPAFAERSWDGLWGELLSPELRTSDSLPQLTGDITSDAAFDNIEEGIESWAAQSLPPVPIQTLTTNSLPDTRAQLCYGMVSPPLTHLPAGK
jgi:hypothetical protein